MVHGKTCRVSEVKKNELQAYLEGDPDQFKEVLKNHTKVFASGTNVSIFPDSDLRLEISFQNCKRLNAFR